ncbi:MAG: DUF2723 domain-containing protein [Chloroflexota bacterium]
MFQLPFTRKNTLPFIIVLAVLVPIYLSTLQTIPNGSENYYMIDVGETQIVLNSWGTLHSTGYPLFVMAGNIVVGVLKLVGVSAPAAPGANALIWGLLALTLIYALAVHLTGRPVLAAGMTILFGLARTVWIHNNIAEIYSFGLVFLALLLLIALWKPSPSASTAIAVGGKTSYKRIYWLAFIGGLAVFHHRGLIMVAPALVYAVWPQLTASWRKLPRVLIVSLLLGVLGFVPYAYLVLRAHSGAAWVYGDPGNWNGFWDQFLGREASRFIGPPSSMDGLLANFNTINTVLVTDITVPGIILGLLGLILALRNRARRRAAITLILSGGVAYLFHIALYTDILSALILPILLSLAFGWLFLADAVASYQLPVSGKNQMDDSLGSLSQYVGSLRVALLIVPVIFGIILLAVNQPFIKGLTSDTTGLQTIAMAQETPFGTTLMIDWGPRHFAVGFARDVLHELPNVTLVSHKANFQTILANGRLITPDFTFYNRPVSWWEEQLDAPVYIDAAAPHLVEIKTVRDMASAPLPDGITPVEQAVECTADHINLKVSWGAAQKPDHDLSVFVHLLDAGDKVIAQADESAPVYGWRPLTTWEAGEIVRDVYPLPRLPEGATISFGLYRQLDTGEFENVYVYDIPATCG